MKITENVRYVGVDDKTIDLFESQYVVPNGISYNSYVILDDKICVMDTVDGRFTEEWLENLSWELSEREPDYLVISHLEPDHAASIGTLCEKYPDMKLVGNDKTFKMLPQFFFGISSDRFVTVGEGDSLSLGGAFGELFSIVAVLISLSLIATDNFRVLSVCAVIYSIYVVIYYNFFHVVSITNSLFIFVAGAVILIWFIVYGLNATKGVKFVPLYDEDDNDESKDEETK